MIASVIILITLSPLIAAAPTSSGTLDGSKWSNTNLRHLSSSSASTSFAQLAHSHGIPHSGGGVGRSNVWEQHISAANNVQPLQSANVNSLHTSLHHPHLAPEHYSPPMAPAIPLEHAHLLDPPEHDEDHHLGDEDFAFLAQFLQSEAANSIDHDASSTSTSTPFVHARQSFTPKPPTTNTAHISSLSRTPSSSATPTAEKAGKETSMKRKFDYSLLQQVRNGSSAPSSSSSSSLSSPSQKSTKNLDYVQTGFHFDRIALPTRRKIYTIISKYTDMDEDTIPLFSSRRIINKDIGQYLLSNEEGKIIEALYAIDLMPVLEWKRGIPKSQRRIVAQRVASALGFNHLNMAYNTLRRLQVTEKQGVQLSNTTSQNIPALIKKWREESRRKRRRM